MGALTQKGPLGATTKTTAEMLERILDKGILVMGDIRIALLDIELLTVKLRLAVMTLDKAIELHERGLSPFGIPLVSEDRMFGGVGEPQLGQAQSGQALGPMDIMEKRLAAIESRLEQLLGGGAVPLEERRREALPAAQPAMAAPQQQQVLPAASGVPPGDEAREAQPAQQRPESTNPFGGPAPPFGGPAAEPGRNPAEAPPPAPTSELEEATQRYRQAAERARQSGAAERAGEAALGAGVAEGGQPSSGPAPLPKLEQATQRYRQAAVGILPRQTTDQQTAPGEREGPAAEPGRSPAEVPSPLPKLDQATQRYRQAAAGILPKQKADQQTAPRERERQERDQPGAGRPSPFVVPAAEAGRSPVEVPPALPRLEQATQRYRQAAAGILPQQKVDQQGAPRERERQERDQQLGASRPSPFGVPAAEAGRSPVEVPPPLPKLDQATQRYREAVAGILPKQKADQQTAPRERERQEREQPGAGRPEPSPLGGPAPLEQATQRYRQAVAGILPKQKADQQAAPRERERQERDQQLGVGERAAQQRNQPGAGERTPGADQSDDAVVWRFSSKAATVPRGKRLRFETLAPARVRWSADQWRTVEEFDTRPSGGALHLAELPTSELPPGARVVFTFYWPDAGLWEGSDFEIRVEG